VLELWTFLLREVGVSEEVMSIVVLEVTNSEDVARVVLTGPDRLTFETGLVVERALAVEPALVVESAHGEWARTVLAI